MAHIHSIYDTDSHFIIDPITRSITSEAEKVTLMQKDHLSERFTFEIPRYVEGHDMSLTDKVEIHYNNIDASNKRTMNSDIYEVDDLQVSPDSTDMVICSWLISKNATMYAGSLNFVVRFVCYEDNTVSYQWFTDVFSGIKVVSGIYNSEVLDSQYGIDAVESWKRGIIAAFEASEVYNSTLTARDEAKNSEKALQDAVEKLIKEGAFTLRGNYDKIVKYSILDVVTHDNKLWICKVNDAKGIEPSKENSDIWQLGVEATPITNAEIDEIDEIVSESEVISSSISIDELENILV